MNLIYLVMTTQRRVKGEDPLKNCPARITKRGGASKLMGSGVANSKEDRSTAWTKININPSSSAVKESK